jgi:hypothetical protein
MKNLFSLIILLLLFIPSSVYSQWIEQTLPGNIRITLGIDFADQNHGITGGWEGDFSTQINCRAYYTTNGGNTWIQATVPDSMRAMVNVSMIDDNLCYGAGAYNLPLAGSSLHERTVSDKDFSPRQKPYYESIGMDPMLQEDYRGYFVESTDGGVSWHPKGSFEDSVYYLVGIRFINAQTGFVLASSPGTTSNAILKTTDGGNNWYYVYPFELNLTIKDIKFVNELNGIAVGESLDGGVILITSDGGETWTESYLSQMTTIYNVGYKDQNNLVLGGISSSMAGAVLKSTDGGYTWQEIHSYSSSYNVDLINVLPGTDYILAAGTYSGDNTLFVDISTDFGVNWNNFLLSQLQSPVPTFSKMVDEQRWYITGTKNTATNGFVIFTDNSGGVPVELTSFSAESSGDKVILRWETATEINNKGFEVERSKSEVRGQNIWTSAGFVQGNGTTTESHAYSFADENVQPGKYQYRLKQIDFDGSFEYSEVAGVEVSSPAQYVLEQNYPNPFNPSTVIKYSIPEKSNVSLKICNILGREIATPVGGEKEAGNYTIEFNGKDLSSGLYLYTLKAGNYISTKKMLLIK